MISFAPPWLLKLSSKASPLVDEDDVHDEMIKMRLAAEREDRQSRGDLFAGPVDGRPAPSAPSLPFPELAVETPQEPPDRMASPVLPPPPPAAPPSPLPPEPPNSMAGLTDRAIVPPGAPPPPADRPPGTFRFPTEGGPPPPAALSEITIPHAE